MTRFTKITALAGIVFAVGGGTALAQSPAEQVYEPGQGVLDVVQSGTPTPTPAATTAPETTAAAPATSTQKPESETQAPASESTPAPAAPATETQQASTGQLPFTGFEAGFVALAGLALLGGGLAMRRASREQS